MKADAVGSLRDVSGKALTTEQMEIARLKAELSRVRMERDLLKKRRHTLRGSQCEVCLCRATSRHLAIVIQCRVLRVSASGYHQHRLRQAAEVGPNQRHRRLSDTVLAVHIKAVFTE